MPGIMKPDEIELHDGLSSWWSKAETNWERFRAGGESRTLLERLNHHNQLAAQFPISPVRVVFTKTGTVLTSAIVRDDAALIDHSLYWMPVMVESEAYYLCAILNSAPVLAKVKPLQAIGLYGARHFDKNVFIVPFPTFDPDDAEHLHLAALGRQAEEEAAAVDISGASTFRAARSLIRGRLLDTGTTDAIVEAVTRLLLGDAE